MGEFAEPQSKTKNPEPLKSAPAKSGVDQVQKIDPVYLQALPNKKARLGFGLNNRVRATELEKNTGVHNHQSEATLAQWIEPTESPEQQTQNSEQESCEADQPLMELLKCILDNPPANYGPVDYRAAIEVINKASVQERQAALQNEEIRQIIIDSNLSTDQRVTVVSSLLVGSQVWQNPITERWIMESNGQRRPIYVSNDFLQYFYLGTGNPPHRQSTMNCWESIWYAAYLAGVIERDYIIDVYNRVYDPQTDGNEVIWRELGWGGKLPTYPQTSPNIGQLLLYQTNRGIPDHVAISLGGDRCISLWTQPNNINVVQNITVTDIPGTVYISDPPW